VNAKLGEPTAAEIEAFYLGRKERFNDPFEKVQSEARSALKEARLEQRRQAFFDGLRADAKVTIRLQPPGTELPPDPSRLLGNAAAPVTIIEFGDFQCPFCQRVQTTLKELLSKYAGKVRLGFRDFPLRDIHPNAQSAAEASRCAAQQDRFWEYQDLLFANQNKLDRAGLLEQSRALKLDDSKFQTCLAEGKSRPKIEEDLKEGLRAGVSGTPGFFINGIFLSGALPASAFEQIVDQELAAKAP